MRDYGIITNKFNYECIKEDNGMFSWFIPELELTFSSKNRLIGLKRARIMIKMWIKNINKSK